MNEFDKLYSGLKRHLANLESQFIAKFIPADPSTKPSEYEQLVKAYCILSHAAIEEYLETVSMRVMKRSIDDWLFKRRYTDTLATLLCTYGSQINISADENSREKRVFDYLKGAFKDAKEKLSKDIYENNGISIKYIRKLMIPVAIDITDDALLLNSLKQLAKERGAYAHKQKINTVLSPEDAKKYVGDCINLCSDIKEKASKKFV